MRAKIDGRLINLVSGQKYRFCQRCEEILIYYWVLNSLFFVLHVCTYQQLGFALGRTVTVIRY